MVRYIPLPLFLISGIALVSCDRTRPSPTAPSPPEALNGRFTLMLTAGAGCAAIPDAAKTRRVLGIDRRDRRRTICRHTQRCHLLDWPDLHGGVGTFRRRRLPPISLRLDRTTSFSSTSPTTTMRRMEDTSSSSCHSAHGSRSSATAQAGFKRQRLRQRERLACGTAPQQVLPVSVFRLCGLFQRPAADIHAEVSRMRRHYSFCSRLECARRQRTGIAR